MSRIIDMRIGLANALQHATSVSCWATSGVSINLSTAPFCTKYSLNIDVSQYRCLSMYHSKTLYRPLHLGKSGCVHSLMRLNGCISGLRYVYNPALFFGCMPSNKVAQGGSWPIRASQAQSIEKIEPRRAEGYTGNPTRGVGECCSPTP